MLVTILIVIFLIQLITAFGMLGFFVFSVIDVVNAVPFVPTAHKKCQKMLELSKITSSQKMADLGSGDGRVVIAFARAGVEAHGYENNPFLFLYSRMRIMKAGLKGKAYVHWKNFWGVDLSRYEIVTVYGITRIMKPLERKLREELLPGTRVISNRFTLPSWPHSKCEDGICLYIKSK